MAGACGDYRLQSPQADSIQGASQEGAQAAGIGRLVHAVNQAQGVDGTETHDGPHTPLNRPRYGTRGPTFPTLESSYEVSFCYVGRSQHQARLEHVQSHRGLVA